MISLKEANNIAAITMKDAILRRLTRYTPVDDDEEVLILAYTRQLFEALKVIVTENHVNLDLIKIENQLADFENKAREAEWFIPTV